MTLASRKVGQMRFGRVLLIWVTVLTLAGCRSSSCEVHGDPLVRQPVPIVYGLLDDDYLDDRRALFPHANELGGCCVESDEWATTGCCVTCQEAEAGWDGEGDTVRRSLHTFEESDRLLDSQ